MKFIKLIWKKGIGPLLTITIKKRKLSFCLCHHLPERSIKFFGIEKYLCSRCFGLVVGLIIGLLFKYLITPIPFSAGIILMLPLIIDGATQFFGWRKSNNFLRFTTGILFSFGAMAW